MAEIPTCRCGDPFELFQRGEDWHYRCGCPAGMRLQEPECPRCGRVMHGERRPVMPPWNRVFVYSCAPCSKVLVDDPREARRRRALPGPGEPRKLWQLSDLDEPQVPRPRTSPPSV